MTGEIIVFILILFSTALNWQWECCKWFAVITHYFLHIHILLHCEYRDACRDGGLGEIGCMWTLLFPRNDQCGGHIQTFYLSSLEVVIIL